MNDVQGDAAASSAMRADELRVLTDSIIAAQRRSASRRSRTIPYGGTFS